MLKTFVSEKDYSKLISVLKSVHEDTIEEVTSGILIYGGANSGKSTLIEVMKKLCPSSSYVPINGCDSPDFLKRMNKSMIFVHCEGNEDKISSYYDNIIKKRGQYFSVSYFLNEKIKFLPGVPVFCSFNKHILTSKRNVKPPIYLHLPNTFNYSRRENIVKKCVEEFLNTHCETH